MPTYDYQCAKCQAVIEVVHKMDQKHKLLHEQCGGKLVRCINSIQVVYRGEGWARRGWVIVRAGGIEQKLLHGLVGSNLGLGSPVRTGAHPDLRHAET